MEAQNKSNHLIITLIIYSVLFYGLWALYEFFGSSALDSVISNPVICELIKEGIIKNLVWTVPAMLLVYHFSSEVFVTLKEMFTNKVRWLKSLPVFAVFTIYILGIILLRDEPFDISRYFDAVRIIGLLFVGITEEMVFRGWLLNATLTRCRKWQAIALNAVMFTIIHFPIWIMKGMFVSTITSFNFLTIMILSIIFSISFIKSRSILLPIALHMYWDLILP